MLSESERQPSLATVTEQGDTHATIEADQPYRETVNTTGKRCEHALGLSNSQDIEQGTWKTLQASVTGCQRCRLCKTRTQTVFGRGNPRARWMLIGEAPGEQEDRQGLPFVGRAGKLLNNMLHAIGLDHENDVYIANVIKCRPPGNRNPSADEIATCTDYLIQQIHLVKPTLILTLGRFAAHTLLETEETILKLRSRVHKWQQVPLIVTYHPAYLLRNLPDKAKAWQDLLFARRTFRQLMSD